jgi:glutathione-specific gamma-glutamylcyclotransferase
VEPKPEQCHRIFAYGSLMWRPGFEFVSAHIGTASGYERRLSVCSHHYRGTPDQLGLVFGLVPGEACTGIVYDVGAAHWANVIDYVRKRELITGVYQEKVLPIILAQNGQEVMAISYVVDASHPQYAPPQSDGETAAIVERASGTAGRCLDYVWNTILHLRHHNIHDAKLEKLALHLPPQAA